MLKPSTFAACFTVSSETFIVSYNNGDLPIISEQHGCYVADGHTLDAPATLTYASVGSRETVQIALTMAALNDLEVKASDIQNTYLTAPCSSERGVWLRAETEFGTNAGKRAIIVRALYGMKSAGSSFRNHLADCMSALGYKSCLADPDLWYHKPMVRPEDSFK